MEPTLDTLDASLPGVKALHAFSNHIQELSELETTLSEPYEVQEKNISTFCEGIMDKIKGMTQEDVTLTVNAPKLNVKINPGDGLGLPICSLIATKMNGSLTLDSSYNKGARFVLELHA